MVDWMSIKTEYITTNTSYRKLGEKYNVHYKLIAQKGKDEGWVEARSQFKDKTFTDTIDAISSDKVNRIVQLQDVTYKALQKIDKVLDAVTPEETPAKSLKALTSALKDIMDVLGIKSDLDKQEQQARIDNLRKQADKTEDTVNELTVVFNAGPEEWNE